MTNMSLKNSNPKTLKIKIKMVNPLGEAKSERLAVEEGPAELIVKDKSLKAIEDTSKYVDKASKKADITFEKTIEVSEEAEKRWERGNKGVEGEGLSSGTMGGFFVGFRREKRAF